MSRRQRSAREKAVRDRVARAKALRRRARARRAATAAAAAVTLAGAGAAGMTAGAAITGGPGRVATTHCEGATTPGSSPDDLTDVDGTLYFTATDTAGSALWRSDGTAAGTVRLKDLGSDGGYYDYARTNLVDVGGTLFFTVEDDDGDELWRTDGTASGTVRVKHFDVVEESYYGGGVSNLTAVGETLFFTADDGAHGEELWRSDGTTSGTTLVEDISPTDGDDYYDDGPSRLTAVGDTLFFTADDGTHGAELWRSDGTASGTVLVKDVRPGPYDSDAYLVGIDDTLYFTARDGVHGRELWRTDGTEAGTELVADIAPGSRSSNPAYLVGMGGSLFFSADDSGDDESGRDLWTSDGTEAGTVLVEEFGSVREYYGVGQLETVGDTLFFTAPDDAHGLELWRSDGTEAGTVLVEDIRPGEYDSYPTGLTAVGGELFFLARDGVHGRELWRSDGTEEGTHLVEDIGPDTDEPRPGSLTEVGGQLFLTADDGVHGEELWRSDGTEVGTALVEDINLGGAFEVSRRADADVRSGTARVRVFVDGAGTMRVAAVGKRWVRPVEREVADDDSTRFWVTLSPTRAAKRELRRTGEAEVRVGFTFTSCGGGVSTATRRYTLRMR